MKKIALLSVLVILLALTMGCASKPATTDKPQPTPEPVKVEDWVIVDHKMKDFGGALPDWVSMTPIQLEKTDKYKDYYVFIEDSTGKDLEGIKLWATGFSAASNIARMVSLRVNDKFAGAAVGDKNQLETYMEQVVKSVSEAQFSGLRTEGDYWIKKQNKTNPSQVEFRYLFLLTVPRSEIDAAIQRSMDGASKNVPKTPEKERAIENVKNLMNEGF
jgi:hypothetical protein